jgi:hypothetical protein
VLERIAHRYTEAEFMCQTSVIQQGFRPDAEMCVELFRIAAGPRRRRPGRARGRRPDVRGSGYPVGRRARRRRRTLESVCAIGQSAVKPPHRSSRKKYAPPSQRFQLSFAALRATTMQCAIAGGGQGGGVPRYEERERPWEQEDELKVLRGYGGDGRGARSRRRIPAPGRSRPPPDWSRRRRPARWTRFRWPGSVWGTCPRA